MVIVVSMLAWFIRFHGFSFNSDSDENLIWTDKTRILVLTNENCTFGVNAVELYHATIPLTVRVIDYVTHETLM